MRNVCKVLSWLSSSTAAALLALAALATPSTALADSPDPTSNTFLCFTCTDTCPDRGPGALGCTQDSNFCVGDACVCNCDPVEGSDTSCRCNN
jgi:hypothetical protein